jgi:hypothetical protein
LIRVNINLGLGWGASSTFLNPFILYFHKGITAFFNIVIKRVAILVVGRKDPKRLNDLKGGIGVNTSPPPPFTTGLNPRPMIRG